MQIISHRGYWQNKSERNQRVAFERSFDAGYGTETDLRDICGKIVISHDMPRGGEITFENVLQIMNGRNLPLALNIKADGLGNEIAYLLKKYGHTDYFTFDMSIPDMVRQVKDGINVYAGKSDIMPQPVLADKVNGIWLDCFYSDWYGADVIDDLIANGKKVCIVSADLHSRDTAGQWHIVKQSRYLNDGGLMLCTDKPNEATEYFYEQN